MEHESVNIMWCNYLQSIGEDIENSNKKYLSWYFCDNEHDANELAELVVTGTKRATASLYILYEYEDEEIPKVVDYSIITNWDGIAKCIIQTTNVEVVPYKDVTDEFAFIEGEGDKSLQYWRNAHWHFFSREMENLGKEPNEEMLVVCEKFTVVFK